MTTTRKPAARKPAAAKPRAKAAAKPKVDPAVAEKAKATAEAVAAETAAEPTVEEQRERRGELIDQINTASADDQAKEIKEQEAAGQGPKIDDDGAIEQMRVARESHVEELTELGELSGPPVVAPQVEPDTLKLKLTSRRPEDLNKKGQPTEVDSARFVGNLLWVVVSGFPVPGEVILDIKRKNGQDHARFSTWAEADPIEINLPGLTGPGDWLIHAEHLVTQVGEGREDGLPRILESNEVTLDLR